MKRSVNVPQEIRDQIAALAPGGVLRVLPGADSGASLGDVIKALKRYTDGIATKQESKRAQYSVRWFVDRIRVERNW